MIGRRSFLGAILGAAAAPAIVRAESIMRVRPIVVPASGLGLLYSGEIGVIERFRLVQSSSYAGVMSNETLRKMQADLLKSWRAVEDFDRAISMGLVEGESWIKTHVQVPYDYKAELIGSEATRRKLFEGEFA